MNSLAKLWGSRENVGFAYSVYLCAEIDHGKQTLATVMSFSDYEKDLKAKPEFAQRLILQGAADHIAAGGRR